MGFGNPANAPILEYDAPISLISQNIPGGNTSLNFPGNFLGGNQLIDVSQLQSVVLHYIPNATMTGCTITLSWFPYNVIPTNGAASDLINVDVFRWAGDTIELIKVIPCRGSGLFINVNRTGGAAVNVDIMRLFGSTRPANQNMMMAGDQLNDGGDRLIVIGSGVNVPAGGSVNFGPLCKYDGPAFVTVFNSVAAAAAQPIQIRIFDQNKLVDIFTLYDGGVLNGGFAINTVSRSFVATRNNWFVQVFNLGTVARLFNVSVVAAPEST